MVMEFEEQLIYISPDGVNGSILVSKTSGMGSNPMRGVWSVDKELAGTLK